MGQVWAHPCCVLQLIKRSVQSKTEHGELLILGPSLSPSEKQEAGKQWEAPELTQPSGLKAGDKRQGGTLGSLKSPYDISQSEHGDAVGVKQRPVRRGERGGEETMAPQSAPHSHRVQQRAASMRSHN